MPNSKNNSKDSSGKSKTSDGSSKKSNGANDKQSTGTVTAAVASPSARDKVKNMDSNRRADAQSNEL